MLLLVQCVCDRPATNDPDSACYSTFGRTPEQSMYSLYNSVVQIDFITTRRFQRHLQNIFGIHGSNLLTSKPCDEGMRGITTGLPELDA